MIRSTPLVRSAPMRAVFAPFYFACLREKVLPVGKVCRLRFCFAEPLHCLSGLGTVVSLVTLPPPCHSCAVKNIGDQKNVFPSGASRSTASVCCSHFFEMSGWLAGWLFGLLFVCRCCVVCGLFVWFVVCCLLVVLLVELHHNVTQCVRAKNQTNTTRTQQVALADGEARPPYSRSRAFMRCTVGRGELATVESLPHTLHIVLSLKPDIPSAALQSARVVANPSRRTTQANSHWCVSSYSEHVGHLVEPHDALALPLFEFHEFSIDRFWCPLTNSIHPLFADLIEDPASSKPANSSFSCSKLNNVVVVVYCLVLFVFFVCLFVVCLFIVCVCLFGCMFGCAVGCSIVTGVLLVCH